MVTVNKKVATEPFGNVEIKTKVFKGVAHIEQKFQLTPLKVVFPSESGLKPGDLVFIPGECSRNDFASKIYTQDGIQFILVSEDLLVGTISASK